MEITEYMWNHDMHHLDLCYLLVDNSYTLFDLENYRELVKLSRRIRRGERTYDLYISIMNWTI